MINDLAMLREVACEIGTARYYVTELNRRRTVENTFPSVPIRWQRGLRGPGFPAPVQREGVIEASERLGGLLKYYHRRAA